MIKQVIAITVAVYLAFVVEFVLFNAFGAWGKPELIVLVIVFCGLYWSIRYSIWAALIGGMLKDIFSVENFGTNICIYVAAAYFTTLIRKNLYQPGSRFSRFVVVFFVLIAMFMLELFLHMRLYDVRFSEAAFFVFIPRVALTMTIATFIFQYLRDLVVRFKL